ncbi:hypothetical protein [Dactylosporangium sp. CA-233914]|uniref:hypothetical protein n=1 Tax=Dactylosporangium sp. CA-233914 TaxID=3239934 RepID=UPI003D8E8B32
MSASVALELAEHHRALLGKTMQEALDAAAQRWNVVCVALHNGRNAYYELRGGVRRRG